MVPKFHQFQHLILDCCEDHINPFYFHCFSGEDMVGKSIQIAASSHALTVGPTVMSKYVLLLAGLWRDLVADLEGLE